MSIAADRQALAKDLPSILPELRLKNSYSIGKLTSDVFTAKAQPPMDLLKSHSTTKFSNPRLLGDDATEAKKLPPLPQLRNSSLNPPSKRK